MLKKIHALSFKVILAYIGFLITVQLMPVSTNAQIIWSNASSTSWLTGANWGGGSIPGASHTGVFKNYPTSGTTGIGIDMGGSTNNGSNNQAVGAIYIDSVRSANFLLGNSSTTANGILTLTGATVNGTPNVIVADYGSNAATLTIQNTQGSGNKTMAIEAGSSARIIACGSGSSSTAIGNTIKINSIMNASGALSFWGGGSWNGTSGNAGGLLKLGAANTFSGGISVGKSDGTSNGILELDVIDAISNTTGNDIMVYPNSELYLAATTGTYALGNVNLNLSGKGNNASLTTYGGALVSKGSVAYSWSGPVRLSADAQITVLSSTLTVTGNISGSGALIKNGNSNSGTLLLTGTANTWSGGTQVGGGILNIGSGSALCTTSLEMTGLNTGVNTTLSLNNTAQTITSLSSSFVPTTGTQTQNIILGSGNTLTLNQSSNTTYGTGSVTTQTSIITGAGALIKSGSGILTLTSSAHSFTGGLSIAGGEIRFNPASTSSVSLGSCPVTLNGGKLTTTGTSSAAQINFGTLKLADNAVIDLGTAVTHSMKFANSTAIGWTTGKILSITNWTGGYNSTAGTKGRLYFGTSASGLTSGQLAQIQFIDGSGNIFPAIQLGSGEVVPKASVITIAATSYGPFYNAAGNTIVVNFTYSGPLTGNYKVQLSDANGAFATDTTTGIIGYGTSAPVTAVIPAATATGDNYRIRVLNGAPVTTYSANNGTNIVLLAHAPAITSVTPAMGIPGSTVTITGANFSSATANNIVYFGAVRANVTAASATSLSVNVPVGATLSPISVLSAATNLSAYEQFPFKPIYDTDLLTNGQINFKGHVDFNAATSTYNCTIGDLDGDGKSDLVVVNAGSGNVYVYRNTSSTGSMNASSFSSPIVLTTAYFPTNAKIADLDGDGMPEIIVTNAGSYSVSVFHNLSASGSIAFAAKIDFYTTTAAAVPVGVTIADFDGDGKPDMAVAAANSNTIAVFRNTCISGSINASSFSAPAIFATNSAPFSITAADFDGDGKMDIAVADTGSATVSVFKNTAAPGIINASSFATRVDFATGTAPYDVVAGDIDGDGKMDIIASNSRSNSISVLRNTTSAAAINSSSFATKVDFATDARPIGIALGDMDGDGKIDIAVANSGANSVSVFRNTASSGSVSSASLSARTNFATNSGPTGMNIGDLDGDGKPDMVTGNQYSGTISVLRNFRLPNVAAITGPALMCSGTTTTFRNASVWGTWGITNAALATITPSGIVTAIASGIDTITYTVVVSGDTTISATIVAILPTPVAGTITGAASVCTAIATTLSDTVATGVWSSSNAAIATVNTSGAVTGVASGTATITYAVTNSCGTARTTAAMVVLPNATAPASISGITTIAPLGATSMLYDSTLGGSWSSNNNAIATISNTGLVTAVSGGYATITYTITNSCSSAYATALVRSISVNHLPAFLNGLTVNLSVCDNAGMSNISSLLRAKDVDTGQTLTWSLAVAPAHGTAVAAFSAASTGGIVSPVGMTYIADHGFTGRDTFIVRITDGVSAATFSVRTTVNPAPAVPVIFGDSNLCVGIPATLTATPLGGIFSDTSTLITVNTIGGVTATSAGTAYAIYTSPANSFNCTSKAYHMLSVVSPMSNGTITGPATVCPAASVTFVNHHTGGIWTSSNDGIATVHDSVVTGIASGTATITYTITNVCGIRTATKPVTVVATIVPGTITGSSAPICPGAATTFANARTGGVWSISNAALASISSAGIVTGISAGSDTVIYSYTNSCGMVGVARKPIILNSVPVLGAISGPSTLLRGASVAFTNPVSGGVWSSVFTTKATVNSTGLVHGVAAGVDTIKYTLTNSCGRAVAAQIVTITSSRVEGNDTDRLNTIEGVMVYPNPNNGNFTIELPENTTNATILILDIAGNRVEERNTTESKSVFNFDHLAKGNYFLSIHAGDKVWNRQIVVQ